MCLSCTHVLSAQAAQHTIAGQYRVVLLVVVLREKENMVTCQEFRGQSVLEIEAVHNLRKVRMYLNVLSLLSTTLQTRSDLNKL